MPNSSRQVNWSIRPAKNIERKMIAEACARLRAFNALREYRYVGMGSMFFSDFRLFHRQLGIGEMISIERATDGHERFEFNKPFQCIEMKWGESSNVLASLDWEDTPTIIWMDYTGGLTRSVLEDVACVVSNASAGSVMAFTVNADPQWLGSKPTERKSKLEEQLKDKVSWDMDPLDFTTRRFHQIGQRIITNEIERVLTDRNGRRQRFKYRYDQLFYFTYRDGAPMVTVGGLLYLSGQGHVVDQAGFSELEFVRRDDEAFDIDVPIITLREQRALDAQLPDGSPECPGLEPEAAERYGKLYRYFPSFTEAEI